MFFLKQMENLIRNVGRGGKDARKLLRMKLKKMNSKGEKQITKHI